MTSDLFRGSWKYSGGVFNHELYVFDFKMLFDGEIALDKWIKWSLRIDIKGCCEFLPCSKYLLPSVPLAWVPPYRSIWLEASAQAQH